MFRGHMKDKLKEVIMGLLGLGISGRQRVKRQDEVGSVLSVIQVLYMHV
jgi:hypothetical protein